MVLSKSTAIAVALLAITGGTALGLATANASAGDASQSDHHRHGNRNLSNNHHFHHITAINPFTVNDVGDNTNISRDVGTPEPVAPVTAAGGAR